MTCGSEIGNAEKYLRELCAKSTWFRGVLQVVMPENYIALFSAPATGGGAHHRLLRPVLEAGID